MNSGRTMFAQVMDFLPLAEFRRCVEHYRGDYKVQSFSRRDQFLYLAFAQLTGRGSLRDIEACLRPQRAKLYHMGFRRRISRNTMAHASETRNWRIFADFARALIAQAREKYRDEPFAVELDQTIYALDSTSIDLCLSIFPWAQFRRHKSAVKVHTLIDLRGSVPTNVYVTSGAMHDVRILDQLLPEAGAFYLLDRGYLDFARLHVLKQSRAFFITRAKQNAQFWQRQWRPVLRSTGLRSDQTIQLTGPKTSRLYSDLLRRIHYFDAEKDLRLVFLTNNFQLPAPIVADLYRARWSVELFFRWIKQHLHIQSCFDTSENAVKTQIWVAITVYVLVAIVKKQSYLDLSQYKIPQILSIALFEKTPLLSGFPQVVDNFEDAHPRAQLTLFNL